jgi:excisionase family DNA binding protein
MAEREISIAEAARRLGTTLTYVYSLVWSGKLPARKINRLWQISADAVAARLKARGE